MKTKTVVIARGEKFNFCVGRPWRRPSEALCIWMSHSSEVHYGTMEEAEAHRKHVNEQTGKKNFIYALVKVATGTEKRSGTEMLAEPRMELEASIDALPLAASTKRYLMAGHISLIGDVVKCTETDLLRLQGIGRKQLNEIIRVLAARGRKLAE